MRPALAPQRPIIRENSAAEIIGHLKGITSSSRFHEKAKELYFGRWTREPGWQATVHRLPSQLSAGSWYCSFEEVGSGTLITVSTVQDVSTLRPGDSVTVSGRISWVSRDDVSLQEATVRGDNVPYLRPKEEHENAEAGPKSLPDDTRGSVPAPESPPTSSVGKGPALIKTVVELDLVGYSTIAATLEAGLDVQTSPKLNQQIQGLVDAGLKAVGVNREAAVMQTTGDGAILVFDRPSQAHVFAEAVQQATRTHNATKPAGIGKRVFRIGIATGELVKEPKPGGGFDIGGMTIARAVRLEAKARPGEVLCDRATFDGLTAEQQKGYGGPETVAGKRDETFAAHRCTLNPDAVKDAEFFTGQTAGGTPDSRATPALAPERVAIREKSAAEIIVNLKRVKPAYRFFENAKELYIGRWTREPGWHATVYELPSKPSGGGWFCIFMEVDSGTIIAASTIRDVSTLRLGDAVTISGRISDVSPLDSVMLEDAIVLSDDVPLP
jgi:class 3 adenylate cyclase